MTKAERREELLRGILSMPKQIEELVASKNKLSKEDRLTARNMIQSLYRLLLSGRLTTSGIFWADKFDNIKAFNAYLYHLSKAGWIISTSKKTGMKNWAELQINEAKIYTFVDRSEIVNILKVARLDTYTMPKAKYCENNKLLGCSDVKLATGEITKTGIVRIGAAKASTHTFKYDLAMLDKYYDDIVAFTTDGMSKLEETLGYELTTEEEIDYKSISKMIIEDTFNDDSMVLGKLLNDSRGRSIYEATRRIFNPIGNKCARALVVKESYRISTEDLEEIYLFIAEAIHGYEKSKTKKIKIGIKAYKNKELPDVDLTTMKGRKELPELIWLERVYAELDRYFASDNPDEYLWTTPGELDFSSSNMVIIGLLLNDKRLLTEYMWQVEGLSKLHIKKVQTPYVFGSSASVTSLWRKAGLEFTTEQIKIMHNEMYRGKFAVANAFKDLLIDNAVMQESMNLVVNKEEFRVICNRYKSVGDITKAYLIYDTVTQQLQPVKHTSTHKEPDLKQFRRFVATALVHNLDSKVMDTITKELEWCIPIYDACVLGFNEFKTMRNIGVREYEAIRSNRKDILKEYFKSIGFVGKKPLIEWNKLQAIVTPYKGKLNAYHILK